MQNLIKCSNQRHVITRNMLKFTFTQDFGMYRLLNFRVARSIRTNNSSNLSFLTSYKVLKQVHREYFIVRRILQDVLYRQQCQTRSSAVRTFRSSSSCLQNENNKSNKENDKSNKENDKKSAEDNNKKQRDVAMIAFKLVLFITIMQIVFNLMSRNRRYDIIPVVPWSEFVHQFLAKGEVAKIVIHPLTHEAIEVYVHPGAVYKGHPLLLPVIIVNVSDINNIEKKIRQIEKDLGIKTEDAVPIHYSAHTEYVQYFIQSLIVIGIIALYFKLKGSGSLFKFLPFSDMKRAKYTIIDSFKKFENPVRFEDVAGLTEAKQEVMEFVDYLKHPDRYKILGAKVPKGALLLGPPGCGKTLLAKAIATEADVPFLSMNGSEFVEMIGGVGAARVRDLFEAAKRRAPSIVYIDEIDTIGRKRVDGPLEFSNSESERTLNQLLVEMDGMISRNDVIILASTNRADVLDKALLRPGRFDRHILIDLPTLEERKQIFERHLKGLSLKGKPSQYSGYLAYLTPGFSGADIANVCNEAALHAVRICKKVVDGNDLMYAIDRVIGGTKKITSSITPATKRVIAYHEAGHALVGWLLKHTDALLKVTIVPRTNLAGGFAQYTPKDQKLYSKEELFERMCMMLGGRVAESLTFNTVSTGAQNDLEKVTKTAYHQVQQFGMTSAVGLLSFDEEFTTTSTKKPYSKKLANLMDVEARRLITDAYLATEKILSENRDKLEIIAEALLKKETLTYEDVEKLIGPPPYAKKRLVEPLEFEGFVPENKAESPQPASA